MKKNFKFLAAAVAAIAMIGCAKDEGAKIETPNTGVETVASFNLTFPQATRAYDGTATEDESAITSAWVLLFDNDTKTLEAKAPFVDTSEPQTGAGPWKATNVKTTSGDHYIYVVVNAPATLDIASYVVANAATSTPGMTMAAFLEEAITGLGDATSKLPSTAGSMFMTGYAETKFVAPTIDVPAPPANNITIGVGRGIAKVNMVDGHTSNPTYTTVSDLAFKVMNNPIAMRAYQQYNMSTKTGTITNEITGTGATRGNYYRIPSNEPMDDYVAQSDVKESGVYVPENWNEESTTHNASSLVIQGVVNLLSSAALVDEAGVEVDFADYTAGDEFWRVYDKTAKAWLPYFFTEKPLLQTIKNAGIVAGYDEADVTTSDNKVTQDDDTKKEFFIAHYVDGQAYWRLPLKKGEKSAIARNDYFWVTIKTIAEIGGSTDSDKPDEDGVIPGKDPDPIDKTSVNITATIQLLEWNGVMQEGNI